MLQPCFSIFIAVYLTVGLSGKYYQVYKRHISKAVKYLQWSFLQKYTTGTDLSQPILKKELEISKTQIHYRTQWRSSCSTFPSDALKSSQRKKVQNF